MAFIGIHKNDILKRKKATFVIRTIRGHYIKVTKSALKGFFAQYKPTETSREKEIFTCEIYDYKDGTHMITIGE
jgi:hypothetical protein